MCYQAAGKAAVYMSVHTLVTDQQHHLKLIISKTEERGYCCEVYRFQTNAWHTSSAQQHRSSQMGNNWGQKHLLPPKYTQFILMSKRKLFLMYQDVSNTEKSTFFSLFGSFGFFYLHSQKDEKQSLSIPNRKKAIISHQLRSVLMSMAWSPSCTISLLVWQD